MGEKKQAVEEQDVRREDITESAEKAATKPTAAASDEAPVGACECPPGCVGLPCCT